MTVVEVLVASGVSAVVASGLASLSFTGGRTLDAGARRWAEVAAVSTVLTQWPNDPSLQSPAPGWSAGVASLTASDAPVMTVTWTRPDGSALSLSIRRHAS